MGGRKTNEERKIIFKHINLGQGREKGKRNDNLGPGEIDGICDMCPSVYRSTSTPCPMLYTPGLR